MRKHSNLILAIAAFLTYAIAWMLFSAPIDQGYWNLRFLRSNEAAPTSIVVVRLDKNQSGGDGDADFYARLLDALRKEAPAHVYLDAGLRRGSPALVAELNAWGRRASLVARQNQADNTMREFNPALVEFPDAALAGSTDVVVAGFWTNFWKYVLTAPCGASVDGQVYRSLGASLADSKCTEGDIRPNFAINPATIRVISATDVLAGGLRPGELSNRKVIVSSNASRSDATLGFFGHGQQPVVFLDVAAAAGVGPRPFVDWNFEAVLIVFAIIVGLARRIADRRIRWIAYVTAIAVALFGPAVLEQFGRRVPAGSTLVVMVVFGAWRLWAHWRERVMQTGHSGLPNFVALGKQKLPSGFNLVVAVIGRYEEFLATLPADLHGECAQQIARRFSVGCRTTEIYHGGDGHFAWIEQDRDPDASIEHFEGMRALFSAPLLVGGNMFDTNVHFGIDRNGQFDTVTRLNTALASAAEALKNGRTIEQFEANRLANAPWELSLLARIDKGMTNGDIWLAYQPQWDYRGSRISGAEALIRWDDPVRGTIRPDEFILQAERAGRIDALTYWVLEQAITSAEAMNALGPRFEMSINLSAQLVDKPSLITNTREIVTRRGIDCSLLTVEVTETASVYNRPAAIKNLQALREMGFRLSIDDFGTGEASLCYLADLPSDELKLDRRFISRMTASDRDRKIVRSTIGLAHALGQVVVAEGIEDIATFDMLRRMGCDIGQGYYIGRPEPFEQLRTRYLAMGPEGGKAFTAC